MTTERIRGSGDLWVAEHVITYDATKSMRAVNITEFRDGKVARETIYFGDPWEPPARRARWVELVEGATLSIDQRLADEP